VIELIEQADVLPAASVAVAWKVVDESSATETESPGKKKLAAEPVPAIEPEQSELVYRFTVEPPSAEPLTSGELSFAGESGSVSVRAGSFGAVESSTYVIELEEQLEVLPAASVAVAWNVVVESSATGTARPGEEKSDAEPIAAAGPEQSELV
jgi:hypothetical protein